MKAAHSPLGGLITASVVGLGLVAVVRVLTGSRREPAVPQPPGVQPLQPFQGQRW